MRIQHNIAALNSYRNLTNNNSAVSKNLEKLSSGYRINRAGDDAAGLAISEKMRAQITGLQKAQDNAYDGISLIQTAEGSLTEVHSMLNRMVELATQSANGTYDKDVDRKQITKEFEALKEEIDRIGDSSNFNGISLYANKTITLQIGASGDEKLDVVLKAMDDLTQKQFANISLGTAVDANSAIADIKNIINNVSDQRAVFGAAQNRLEHTINNLSVNEENMTSAESRIRDVDIADEMMAYTKNNILVQSAQAMLAQANQVPQGVLQLLQ